MRFNFKKAMEIDSDDDPVVKEIDVYYSTSLADSLYLLQVITNLI